METCPQGHPFGTLTATRNCSQPKPSQSHSNCTCDTFLRGRMERLRHWAKRQRIPPLNDCTGDAGRGPLIDGKLLANFLGWRIVRLQHPIHWLFWSLEAKGKGYHPMPGGWRAGFGLRVRKLLLQYDVRHRIFYSSYSVCFSTALSNHD